MTIQEQQRDLTPGELSVLTFLSQQRALRLDQVPRLLALVEGQGGTEQAATRKSVVHHLVEYLQRAGFIQMRRFGHKTPGWLWLTKSGMHLLGLSPSSWKRPTRHVLPALHAANTIRLQLTERDPLLSWVSQQDLRRANAGKPAQLVPTALVQTEEGERIALHVVLRITGTEEQIATRMLQQLERTPYDGQAPYSALWYYATADAAKRLRAARARVAAVASHAIARKIEIFSYPLVNRQVLYRGHGAPILALAWSPDGTMLASAGKEKMLHVWDASTGKVRFRRMLLGFPNHLTWSCNGAWLAACDQDGRLSLWEGATGKLLRAHAEDTEQITGLVWSPLHHDVVASCSAHGRLRMDDLCQNALRWETHYESEGNALAWSPDGTRLALGGTDPCVHVINAATGQHLQTYTKHHCAIRAVAWSPDSTLLASASNDAALLIWEACSGKKRRTIWSPWEAVSTLAWSPDGTRLAGAGNDSCVHAWDVSTGRMVYTYADHADVVTALAWSPDGTQFASASRDGTVHVFAVPGES